MTCPDFKSFAERMLQSVVREFRLNRNNGERLDALDGKIRDVIQIFEDSLEYHVLNQIISRPERHQSSNISLDLYELNQDTDSFIQSVKKLKEEYINELLNPMIGENDCSVVSSRSDFVGNESKMVGFSDEFHMIRDELITGASSTFREPKVVSLVGMVGIGKSTLAKELFEDELILSHFNLRAWVNVGPKFQLKEMMRGILAQVNPETDKVLAKGDDQLADYMFECLKNQRYLIVLDDVWNTDIWVFWKILLDYYNNHKLNGSAILLTTRLGDVAGYFSGGFTKVYDIRFLNQAESWNLLREKVFGKELCPPQLREAGMKIAENCEGLPLTIITVAQILSKAEKTPEYWRKVADKQTSVFKDAYDQMMDVLYPSYKYLPQYLKACFLYLGIFPQNYEIPRSRLTKLWSVEGLIFEQISPEEIESFAHRYLSDLLREHVVMVGARNNTYRLHSVIWYLCIRQAEKIKFFHVLNSYADSLSESMNRQRRLCIYKNVLFGIKDVIKAMASVTTARSLLCTGPYHQYPVPICCDLRLLRVLDAITLRFYEFPMQVLKLVQLRYLALTYDGELPPSISKLWNLEYLIIRQHQSIIKLYEDHGLHLPIEIWDMKELKHLQVIGSILPDPPHDGVVLPNLLKFLDVNARSCTKGVLRGLPNLAKLGILIEVACPAQPSSCFDNFFLLNGLNSFRYVVVNPIISPPPPAPLWISSLPSLTKLSLSGCGYLWEDMRVLSSLPKLQELKLQCYAFRGPIWEVEKSGFPDLRHLVIEDTDLVQWKGRQGSFRFLWHLTLKNCYKLQEICWESDIRDLDVELFDCSPKAVSIVKQMQQQNRVRVILHSSL